MALYILIALATISAAAILFVRTVLSAALCLILCLLSIAGIYILLSAEFLAVVQILIYAGGILLLVVFGIMITRHQDDPGRTRSLPALLVAFVLVGLLWYGLFDIHPATSEAAALEPGQVGVSLMTQYVAPFEWGGVLLLVSLIGAMITSTVRSQS